MNFKNFVALTIAGIINALGITMFLTPVKLYDSGISRSEERRVGKEC